MTDLDRMIRDRVDAFVDEISQLVRRAALEAVSEALGGDRPAKARVKPATRASKRGGKRSAAELDSLADGILRSVGEHPGAGAREIARALGVTTTALVLPTKKLVSAGSLTTKGQKRATRYFRAKK